MRLNSAGEIVPEQTLHRVFDAEGNWQDVLLPNPDTSVALAVLHFAGEAVTVELKSAFHPLTVATLRLDEWGSRDDDQRSAFLKELVRRLWTASKAATDGVLLPAIKKEIVTAVLAEHWARTPQETKSK